MKPDLAFKEEPVQILERDVIKSYGGKLYLWLRSCGGIMVMRKPLGNLYIRSINNIRICSSQVNFDVEISFRGKEL